MPDDTLDLIASIEALDEGLPGLTDDEGVMACQIRGWLRELLQRRAEREPATLVTWAKERWDQVLSDHSLFIGGDFEVWYRADVGWSCSFEAYQKGTNPKYDIAWNGFNGQAESLVALLDLADAAVESWKKDAPRCPIVH